MKDSMPKVQLEILGLSASQASSGAYALILKEAAGTRRLPIVIGANEAQAIAIELEGIKAQRPMTHDLMKNIIEQLNATVTEVCIVDLRDSTFYASIMIDGISVDVDARPSDAIALAVRFNAPIYVSDSILDEVGFDPDNDESTDTEAEGDEEENDLTQFMKSYVARNEETTEPDVEEDISNLPQNKQLQVLLARAIKAEDYEKAAQLRDEIQKLNNENQ